MIALIACAWAQSAETPHGPGVSWSTIETRFFRVHFPSSGDASAVATATAAAELVDPLLLRISADAGFVPRGPYHLVVSDAVEGMTAYSLPSAGIVVISTDPGSAVLRLRGRLDWVEDALAHELSHLVWHRRASPFAGIAAFGVEGIGVVERGPVSLALDVPLAPDLPYGWSEGLAERGSEKAGVNLPDARRRALLVTSALEGRLLTWDEWLVGVDKDDTLDAERAYQQGYAFVGWLVDTQGGDVLRDVADWLAAGPGRGLGGALRHATGVPARTLWARHRARLQVDATLAHAAWVAGGVGPGREVEPWLPGDALSDADRRALADPREIEEEREGTGTWDLFPKVSPDGRFYVEGKSGYLRVVRTDTPRTGSGRSAWIPAITGVPAALDADHVVWAAPATLRRPDWAPAPAAPRTRLWRLPLDVDDLRRWRREAEPLPDTERARDPALGPDGRLVFVVHADGGDQLREWTPRGTRALSSFPAGTWLQSPSFSPDGAHVAVSVFRDGRGELWTLALDELRWTRVLSGRADVLDPCWSDEGILLTTVVDDGWEVVRLDPDTDRTVALTSTLGGASTPSVGPDGDLYLSVATPSGQKSTVIRAEDLVAREVVLPTVAPRAAVPRSAADPPRAYRPWPVRPAIGPVLAIESTAGVPSLRAADVPGLRIAGGTWLSLGDATGSWAVDAWGVVGTVPAGSADLTWAGLGLPLRLGASGASTPDGRRSASTLSLEADLRWNDALTLVPSVSRVAADGALRSDRMGLAFEGEAPDDPREPFGTADLYLAAARSETDGEVVDWARAEVEGRSRIGLRSAWGPLREHRQAIELSGAIGVTSADVGAREELAAGGDTPAASRPLAIETTSEFPGLPGWALRGEHRVVAGGRWVAPIAPRLRSGVGLLHVRGFELAAGADLAAVADFRVRTATLAADLAAEVRVLGRLADAPWDSRIGVAAPFGVEAPPRVWVAIGASR